MAFTTSVSGFGIKPATGAGIFGTATQPQQQQQQQTTGFGNAPALGQTQPQQGNGLFGGGFGQNTQQNQQQNAQQPQQTTNLFGQPQQPQQQQSNLFGQSQQQPQQQQQQPQQQGNSLFGGSLFGQNNQQQQPQQQQQQQPQQSAFGGFGSFGANNQQQQQPQQQQQQQQSNLFGSTTTGNAFGGQSTQTGFGNTGGNTGLGGTLFGSKSQAPQQPQQQFGNPGQNTGFANLGQSSIAQSNAPPPFTNQTKFNDLPDQMKAMFEQIDSLIQGRVQISKDIQQRKLGDEPMKGKEAIRNLHKDLVNTATTIRNDLQLTQDLRTKVDQSVEDTIVATRIIDGFRNPQSGNTYLKDHADFPLEYFIRVGEQMKERLAWYQSTIEQIERKLASISSSAQTPQGISATLQAQHATFLALASKTAAVDAELQKVKAVCAQIWRSKTGSVRDPFNDTVKPVETGHDFGLSRLHVR